MAIYYSREIEVELENHGNDVIATMLWFDGEEIWPYDEWGETVKLSNVKMMNEREIEEAIKEELKKTVDREFDADTLVFTWEMGR